MKVAKCCESKEPELLTFEQMMENEGIYRRAELSSATRFIVIKNGDTNNCGVIFYCDGIVEPAGEEWEGCTFLRTSETLCVGLKDANGKWVE